MATYYVKNGGNDVADGLSEANAWASLTKLNATTFVAGDIIKLNKGNSWTGMWTVLGSGASGNPITITNYGVGALPIIDANGASAQALRVNGNSYITIDGIDARNASQVNIYGLGTVDGFTVKNCVTSGVAYGIYAALGANILIDGNTIYQGVSAEGIYVANAGSAAPVVSNNTLIGVAGRTGAAVYLHGSNAVFSTNNISNWLTASTGTKLVRILSAGVTLGGNSITGCGGYNCYFENATGVILSGTNTSDGSLGHGAYFTGAAAVSGSGRLVVTNCLLGAITFSAMTGNNIFPSIFISGAGQGLTSASSSWRTNYLSVKNITGGHGVSISGTSSCVILGGEVTDVSGAAGYDGIAVGDSSTLTVYNVEIARCKRDGLSSNNTAVVSAWYVTSHDNGSAVSTSGDGFTNHHTSTLNLHYCLGYKNWKSGIVSANSGGGGGVVYNCTFYDNYNAGNPLAQWYGMAFDGGTWIVKNNITKHHPLEISIAVGATVTSDYNCFHDSRGGLAFRYSGTNYSWADYKTISGKDSHSLNADPKLVDAANGKFYLRYDSPCIDTGADLGTAYLFGLDKLAVWPDAVLLAPRKTADIGAYPYRSAGHSFPIPDTEAV